MATSTQTSSSFMVPTHLISESFAHCITGVGKNGKEYTYHGYQWTFHIHHLMLEVWPEAHSDDDDPHSNTSEGNDFMKLLPSGHLVLACSNPLSCSFVSVVCIYILFLLTIA